MGSPRVRAFSFAILIAALVLVAAIWGAKPNAVTGSITFGGDREIPAGAVLTAQLRDISWQDAPSKLIALPDDRGPGELSSRLRRAIRTE